MKHILAKVDRIRAAGTVMVQVADDSPYAAYNGKTFKVHSIGTPGVKCRISLEMNESVINLNLTEVL
ncbi:hypothetical protein [Mucilaginibacter lacusdianchii]|uniref:hypothetical protein n=1 Tax=Mucilaginibacter lacusdianchii TaxID=2684211 RepID=UPI00131B3426|nr:hypothetical protein [Mucilaginibacter sp. JXJ CY 39]